MDWNGDGKKDRNDDYYFQMLRTNFGNKKASRRVLPCNFDWVKFIVWLLIICEAMKYLGMLLGM